MRAPVAFLVWVAALAYPRLAPADDGGGRIDAAERDAVGDACDDCADAAAPAPVVACDGGLCDTLQGRPSCAMTPSPMNVGGLEFACVGGVGWVALARLRRRGRRGA